ncbi:MAG: hypothetical protein ABI707_12445 [Ferruginibacter sp.]
MKSIMFRVSNWRKWRLLILLTFQASLFSVYGQVPAINKIEYFLDTDPGYGNATNLSFSGTTDASGIININLLPLTEGVHIVGVRSRDIHGAWSLDNRWLFVKPYSGNTITQPNINRVEWYLDNDPGYGNGTALPITSSVDLAGLSFNINIVPLVLGVHIVGVRSRDSKGAWSLDNRWLFVKPYGNSAIAQPNINRVEYYVDNDPGYGNATPISISPAQDLASLAINITLASLNEGVHIVGIRSRDVNGSWSLDNKWIFLKPYSIGVNTPVPDIVKMEYYVDVDPGYGHASAISITPGADINMLVFDANISGAISTGTHKIGIRSLDARGAWSLDNEIDFTRGGGNTWTGVTSTAWTTASNWSKGAVPVASDNITIPAGTPFSPLIANGVTGNCKSMNVNTGSIVTVATGGNLKVGQ